LAVAPIIWYIRVDVVEDIKKRDYRSGCSGKIKTDQIRAVIILVKFFEKNLPVIKN
jgi:hypothetical protein